MSEKAKRGRDAVVPVVEEGDFEDDDLKIDDATTEKVSQIQQKLLEIQNEESVQVLKIQNEFDKRKSPFFAQRAELLKTIPEFWGIVLSRHPAISPYLQEKNTSEVFKKLEDVNVENILTKDQSGFKVTLTFGANEYFTNRTVEITLTHPLYPPEASTKDSYSSVSSPIQWKKNIIEIVDAQNAGQAKKRKSAGKDEAEEEDDDDDKELTFFSLFTGDPNMPFLPGLAPPPFKVFQIISDIFDDPIAFLQHGIINSDEPSDSDSDDDDDDNKDDEDGEEEGGEDDETSGTKKFKVGDD